MFCPGYPTLDSEALLIYLFCPNASEDSGEQIQMEMGEKQRKTERDGFSFIHEYALGAFKNGKDFPDMIFLCSKSAVSRKLFVINPMKAVSLCDGKTASKGSLDGDDDCRLLG